MRAERPERLDAHDPEDDLTTRRIANIIAEICCDLGLDALPDADAKQQRAPQDIESLNDRGASPPPPSATTVALIALHIG